MGTPRSAAVGATLASLLAGVGVAAQTWINGRVNADTGSPILATAVNHGSALVLATVVALAMGAFPRAARNVRHHRTQLRWWWFLGGLMGFAGVFTIVLATPLMGVVTVGVAITLGQLAGSVVADLRGLGPGGRRPLTVLRGAGLAVALLAVAVGAVGRFEASSWWMIPLLVIAGALIAIQQAANGWLATVTGEFAVMSVVNFLVSGVFVGSALLVSALVHPLDLAAVPAWAPLGGIIGAIVGVVFALALRTIGVLGVVLCVAAGQAVGGILLDLLAPVARDGLPFGAVVAAILAVVAVGLPGLDSVRGLRAGAAEE